MEVALWLTVVVLVRVDIRGHAEGGVRKELGLPGHFIVIELVLRVVVLLHIGT